MLMKIIFFSLFGLQRLRLERVKLFKENISKSSINVIYTYEDCALESFKVAKKKILKHFTILQALIGVSKKIIDDELKSFRIGI